MFCILCSTSTPGDVDLYLPTALLPYYPSKYYPYNSTQTILRRHLRRHSIRRQLYAECIRAFLSWLWDDTRMCRVDAGINNYRFLKGARPSNNHPIIPTTYKCLDHPASHEPSHQIQVEFELMLPSFASFYLRMGSYCEFHAINTNLLRISCEWAVQYCDTAYSKSDIEVRHVYSNEQVTNEKISKRILNPTSALRALLTVNTLWEAMSCGWRAQGEEGWRKQD